MASSGSMGTLSWSAKLDSNEFKKGVRKVKKQMKEAQKSVVSSAKMISSGFAIATSAIAGTTVALGAMVAESGRAIKELEVLSKVADTGFSDFIKMAEGAKKFGVQSDKLSDILKDVKDRVGDFIATGGGPMKDFFEQVAPKVGVTAEAFKDLSGKDALQLFFNSLEKANLSQAEMVFYLEAMASDLTLLQPLLANNGKLMKKFGDEAERAGLILPDDKVQDLKNAMMGFERLSTQITASIRNISAELAPTFEALTNDITDVLQNSTTELEVLFRSIGDYFSLTVDGMRQTLESLGIIDEFYSWQDAFLDVSFFLQNTFNHLMLAMSVPMEKLLSTTSYLFRLVIAGVVKGVQYIFKLVGKGMSLLGMETQKVQGYIEELQDTITAYDVTNLTGAFDGAISGAVEDELAKARKAFDKTVEDLKRKRREVKTEADKVESSNEDTTTGGGIFGAIFNGANKAIKGIESAVKFMKKPNDAFNKGVQKWRDENKEEEIQDVVRAENTLATAGSIEEFNLIKSQRKEELNILKKIADNTAKSAKQSTSAGFTK